MVDRKRISRWLAAASLFAGASAAQAQTGIGQPNGTQSQNEAGGAVGTETASVEDEPAGNQIIVTGRRIAERLQDVPLSIAAVTGEQLQAQGIDDIRALADRTAGVELTTLSPGLNRVTIRGISNFGEIGESTVGYYIDEMPVSADPFAQPDVKMFDIDRVEFLRGPQGTLFGEASLGGTVRILLNKPDPNEWGADAEGEVSTTRRGGTNYVANAMVNVPIARDKLGLRIVGTYRNNAGWIDNVGLGIRNINDEESWSTRTSLRFLPADNVTLTGTWIHNEVKTGGLFFSNRDREQSTGVTEPREDVFDQFSAVLEVETDFANLTASANHFTRDTSRPRQELGFLGPLLGLFIPGFSATSAGTSFDLDYSIWTGEVRLASAQPGFFTWQVGAFYKNSKRDENRIFYSVPALPIPPASFATADAETSFEQLAFFGEGVFAITPKVNLTAGVRYFVEDQRGFTANQGLFFNAVGQAVIVDAKGSAEEVTPRVILDFKPNEDVTLYASAAKGFRSGGVNRFSAFIPGDVPERFDPDTLWNYEVGAKTSFLDRRITLNAAAYYIDWKNVQVGITPPGSTFGFIDNVGKAVSKGFEVEAVVRPVENLTLTANGNYTDSTIKRDVPGGTDESGNRLPLVPKYKVGGSAQYRAPLGRDLALVGLASYTRVGRRFNELANTNTLRAYENLSLRLSLESEAGWDVAVFADNVTDSFAEYLLFDNASAVGAEYYTNRPRTIGANARIRF